MAKKQPTQFSTLIDLRNPHAILDEIRTIILSVFPGFDYRPIETALDTGLKIFNGHQPGYRKCNTEYHDLQHTFDVLLAMSRLIHGACHEGVVIDAEHARLGLIAALFHDIGYIQKAEDLSGTGAKYTLVHIERGIEFLATYLGQQGRADSEAEKCRSMLLCTGFNIPIPQIPFPDEQTALLGRMLGSADLLGQMADRTYLEKLLFLYYEFKEGNVGDYQSELDLLQKTQQFYTATQQRLETELDNVRRFMRPHFKARWNIDKDLYEAAIRRNRQYLEYILKHHHDAHREFLRRDSIVKRLKEQGR